MVSLPGPGHGPSPAWLAFESWEEEVDASGELLESCEAEVRDVVDEEGLWLDGAGLKGGQAKRVELGADHPSTPQPADAARSTTAKASSGIWRKAGRLGHRRAVAVRGRGGRPRGSPLGGRRGRPPLCHIVVNDQMHTGSHHVSIVDHQRVNFSPQHASPRLPLPTIALISTNNIMTDCTLLTLVRGFHL